jgi:hypothetical protein
MREHSFGKVAKYDLQTTISDIDTEWFSWIDRMYKSMQMIFDLATEKRVAMW